MNCVLPVVHFCRACGAPNDSPKVIDLVHWREASNHENYPEEFVDREGYCGNCGEPRDAREAALECA